MFIIQIFTHSATSLLQVAFSSIQRQQIGVGCSTSLCWALWAQALQVISTKVLRSVLTPRNMSLERIFWLNYWLLPIDSHRCMKIIKDDTVITSIFLMVYLQLTETESSWDNLGPGETSLIDLRSEQCVHHSDSQDWFCLYFIDSSHFKTKRLQRKQKINNLSILPHLKSWFLEF